MPAQQEAAPLVVYVIYDGESYQLEEFFHRSIQDLDQASGEHLHFIDIGHPGQSGKIFRGIAKPLLGKKWTEVEDRYIKKVLDRHLEHDRRREAMQELAERFAIPPDEIPALLIPVPLRTKRAVWLTIPQEWYATQKGQRAFGRALREWSASPLVKRTVERGIRSPGIEDSLRGVFDALGARTTELLHEEEAAESRASRMRGPGWAPSFESARIAIRTSTQQVFYHRCELRLSPTDFRLLLQLAEQSGKMVPHAELHQNAGEYPEATGTDPSVWAKNHKRSIMIAFRELIGLGGIESDEVRSLIVSRNHCMGLMIPKAEVYIE